MEKKNGMVESMITDQDLLAIKLAETEHKESTFYKLKTADHNSLSENGNITSGNHLSFWFSSSIKPIVSEKLNSDVETDILVVGGGIAGLTTAY